MKYTKLFISTILLFMANTIPMYFATLSIPTILRSQGTALTIIGLFGSLMLPWAFKFLWAPIIDKYNNVNFGKRKSWYIPALAVIIIMFASLLFISPQKTPLLFFIMVAILLIGSATHYLASSAYILEQFPADKLRFGNYAQVIGTACGSFTGGGLFLIMYDKLGWHSSVLCVMGVLSILFLILLLFKEDPSKQKAKQTEISNPSIISFFKRINTRHLFIFCLIYRGCEGIVMGMQQPFLVDQHIAIATIGKIMGISGLTLSLFASGCISLLLKGNKESIWLFILGVIRSICYFSLGLLAYYGITDTILLFSVVVVNMACRSMEMVVLYTFFMQNCDARQSATDISILLCAELLIYSGGMMLSGFLVKYMGYVGLFFFGSGLSIISTIICAYILYKVIDISKQQLSF